MSNVHRLSERSTGYNAGKREEFYYELFALIIKLKYSQAYSESYKNNCSSFYPSIMSVYHIAPKHMIESVFTKLVTWIKDTRIKAKHSSEPIDGIPSDVLAQVLKIVINSIYGKLGYQNGDLFDRLATLRVTINGQLMIMMLCEELELNGIEVVSANTDGIVVKLHKYNKIKFDEIAKNWMKLTGLSADSEEYLMYINRDIDVIGVLTL